MSNNMNLHNYFYGTEDHYYHPGWYFDLIVNTVNDLSEQAQAIRPGRFVLVSDSEAVFMRTGDNESYWFVPPIRNDNDEYYYYNDYEHVSGKSVDEVTPEGEYVQTTGYRFIAYTNKMAQVIMENNGSLAIPYDSDGKPVLYSANTDQMGNLASYYFGN